MGEDKKREEFLRDAAQLYDEMISRAGRTGDKFDDIEEQAEEAGRKIACELLANRLAAEEQTVPEKILCSICGGPMRRPKNKGQRKLDTFSGPVSYERRHAICDRCKSSFSPAGPPTGDSTARRVRPPHSEGL